MYTVGFPDVGPEDDDLLYEYFKCIASKGMCLNCINWLIDIAKSNVAVDVSDCVAEAIVLE